jgi:hypothetical protein
MQGGGTHRITDPGGSTVTASTDVTSQSRPTTTDAPAVGVPAGGVVVAFPRVRPHRPGPADGGSLTINCAECAHRHTDICDDCVVSFIVGREPEDALVVDAEEVRAVRLLERAGLVPGVRHEARASGE